jgi:hypothetical protein
MVEPLFISTSPSWPVFPSPGLGWPQGPIAFRPLPGVGMATAPRGPQPVGTLQTDPSGFGGAPTAFAQSPLLGPGFTPGLPAVPGLFGMSGALAGFVSPEIAAISSIPALLATVAMRRGQPMGPTNDQELEDFIYDALELLPGTSDVEVRCEGGRVTFTGAVQHKRLKRDVGEIAWTIPVINDVQNNVTISTKRRSRAGREAESHTGASTRKQA